MRKGITKAQKAELSKESHNKEDIDPSEDDLGRGKYLKVIIRTIVIRHHHVETHRANALTKGGRENVEDVHGWREPLCESFVAALRLIEFVGFPLKYGEDSIRMVTALDLFRERVGPKFLPGLLLVLLQRLIEDRLEIWSSGGHRLTGRHGLC